MVGPLKVAFVGFGARARTHARMLSQLRDLFVPIAVSSRSYRGRDIELPSGDRVRYYEEFDELLALDGVDVVVVSTPIGETARVAEQALLAEKHVFVEKPTGASLVEAQRLVDLVSQSDRVGMVAEQVRFMPAVLRARELLDGGFAGQVRCVEIASRRHIPPGSVEAWRRDHEYPIGFFWDGGVHMTALVQHLCGEIVAGQTVLSPGDADVGRVGGVVSFFDTDQHIKGMLSYVRSACELGYSSGQTLIAGDEGSLLIRGHDLFTTTESSGAFTAVELDPPVQCLTQQWRHFHDAIRAERQPTVNSLRDGFEDLQAVARLVSWANPDDPAIEADVARVRRQLRRVDHDAGPPEGHS